MMNKSAIESFLAQKKLAVVGVSRKGNKFGNTIYKDLKSKGYLTFAVNPNQGSIDGNQFYPNLHSLPQKVDGVIIVIPPEEMEKIVQDAVNEGIKHVWIQQGAESDSAIQFCKNNNINVVYGECILMFAEPVAFFHRLHRLVWKLFGKLHK
jgi:predicted CoA-binding protein